ncbi:MAG TPA: hypothetical protein VHT91_01455 [Kofleriaceae bacterium]|jgi:hypothetical protein|nr:hypothetical protein [Kofleriaceae bacterium]
MPADANGVAHPDAHRADAAPPPTDAGGSTDAIRPGGDAGGPGGDGGNPASDGGNPASDAGNPGSDAGNPGSDAGNPGSDAGGSGGTGVISCYTEGNPGATCTLPTHCCFSNYSSQHDGACSTAACTWGTMECDGPEDCSGGQHCCAHAIVTPDSGVIGYQMACQASACGAAPANQEMCHPTGASAAGTCSSPTSRCVTAFGNDSDLPPSLHICQ